MRMRDIKPELRPRELLARCGASNLSDAQLLALILRVGTPGKGALNLARQVLRQVPLAKLKDTDLAGLSKISGIDAGKGGSVVAAFELSRRAYRLCEPDLPVISSAEEAVGELKALRRYTQEHFCALFLNARNQVLRQDTIFIGTLDACLVHPREVFERALRYQAANLIIAHNHPSGSPSPSAADRAITQRLAEAGRVLGVLLLDHLIVTSNGYYSFAERGELQEAGNSYVMHVR
jgi:DNA repair protein RadC